MDCVYAKSLISDYIDNELDAEQVAALEAHLFKCFDCATEFNETANTVLQLLDIESVPVPASFDERLHQALLLEKQIQHEQPVQHEQSVQQKRKVGYNKNLKAISGIAAVLVIGIFSVAMFNHMGNQGGGAPNMQAEVMPSMRAMLDYDELEQFTNNGAAGDAADGIAYILHQMEYAEDYYALGEEEIDENEEAIVDEEDELLVEEPEQAAYDEAPQQAVEQAQHDVTVAGDFGVMYGEDLNAADIVALATGIEHYFSLIRDRYAGMEFEILGYSYNETTRIYSIEVYVVTVPGLVTETHTWRARDGGIWQVVRD